MQIFGRVLSSVSEFYKDINPSTLSGAIDVVVVEDVETGQLSCSPFHVRFGKLQVLRPTEKKVEVEVNGKVVDTGEIGMKIGLAGETFFVIPVEGPVPSEYQTSPLVQPIKPGLVPPRMSLSPAKKAAEVSRKEGIVSLENDIEEEKIIARESKSDAALSDSTDDTQQRRSFNRKQPLSDSELDSLPLGSITSIYGTIPPKGLGPAASAGNSIATASAGSIGEAEEGAQWTWKWGDLPERGEPASPTFIQESKSVAAVEASETVEMPKSASLNTLNQLAPVTSQASLETTPLELTSDLSRLEDSILSSVAIEQTEISEASVLIGDFLGKKESITLMYDTFVSLVAESSTDLVYELLVITDEQTQIQPSALQDYRRLASILKPVGWEAFEANYNSSDFISKSLVCLRNNTSSKCCIFRIKSATQLLLGLRVYGKLLPLDKFLSLCDLKPEQSASTASKVSWRQWWSSPRASPQSAVKLETSTAATIATTAASSKVPSSNVSDAPQSPPKSPLGSLVRASSSPDLSNLSIPKESTINYSKSLRLPSEVLRKLGLHCGMNQISFSVVTSKNGKATCTARIFLWRSDDKIIISDIDGTITKSDALGHLFHFVGKDWTHSGIANLFTDIARNGYRFLYLTSRALGQANSTRIYLRGIEQDRYQLPEGPVIMSPDRFFTAVRREVIEGNPEQFKVPCLLDIRRLFFYRSSSAQDDTVIGQPDLMELSLEERTMPSPFYAGFGNRYTDAISYRAVGIAPSRIYIINPEGNLSLQIISGYRSSYVKLVGLVDNVFPPLNEAIERDELESARIKTEGNGAEDSSNVNLESTSTTTTLPSASAELKHSFAPVPATPIADVDNEDYNDLFFWRQPFFQPERVQLNILPEEVILSLVSPHTVRDEYNENDRLLAKEEAAMLFEQNSHEDDGGKPDQKEDAGDKSYFDEKEEAGLIPFA